MSPRLQRDERPATGLDSRTLLTVAEAANWLGVKEATLRRWTRTGAIPCYRLGHGAIRFSVALLKEYLASRLDRGQP